MTKHTRWIPLFILLLGLACFYYLGWHHYFTFDALRTHHTALMRAFTTHQLLVTLIYAGVYILVVAFSIPGATLLTLVGGYLFGLWWGTGLVVIAATIGATLIMLAVKTALATSFAERAGHWAKQLKAGFRQNAFLYLLTLRFIPLFPFFIINIVAGLLNVPLRAYISATCIGIIPGTFVYVSIGHGLSALLSRHTAPDLGVIFQPTVLWPLIGLGVLSLLPILVQKMKRKSPDDQ